MVPAAVYAAIEESLCASDAERLLASGTASAQRSAEGLGGDRPLDVASRLALRVGLVAEAAETLRALAGVPGQVEQTRGALERLETLVAGLAERMDAVHAQGEELQADVFAVHRRLLDMQEDSLATSAEDVPTQGLGAAQVKDSSGGVVSGIGRIFVGI